MAWEFGYRILCEKEEPLLEGGQEDIEGQLETKQVPLNLMQLLLVNLNCRTILWCV